MSIVNSYGFDGVDVDNEEAFKVTLLTTFFSDLRSNLGTKTLTADAVDVNYSSWTPGLASYLDRVNIETYAMASNFDNCTWFNAALLDSGGSDGCFVLSVNLEVTRFLASGIPAAKLGIGLPFYGNLWTGNNGPRQAYNPSTETDVFYKDIVASYKIGSTIYDPTGHQPWVAVSGGSWLNWDNAQSITEKVNYVRANSLGGWIIWALGYDYIPGASPSNPLLDAAKQALLPPAPPPEVHIGAVK
jgi:chitinase